MLPSIDPGDVGNTGLVWLLLSYGYVLFFASNMIAEGSDLLLLVPSMAGLVGGVVLPSTLRYGKSAGLWAAGC